MTARKPFTKRERARASQHPLGMRPTNRWGDGDLPAPWAAGDVVELTDCPPTRLADMMGPFFVVTTAFSIDDGDAWYFRVTDSTADDRSSDRLHVACAERCSRYWTEDVDYMSCFTLVETADPDGLALRAQRLRDGWSLPPERVCTHCGRPFEGSDTP